ncbi:MAG TPA: capsule biosynthesis protein [Acetobacteraceae bacterium]|nr:capsule biosynthesis protein [Acetobacteraceae bacterium]
MKLSPHTTRFEGAVPPADGAWSEAGPLPPPRRPRRSLLRHPFFWWVIAPTLIVAAYLYGIAADQYVSEARFVVRGRAEVAAPGLGQALAQVGLGGNQSNEAQTVREFLISHDATRRLNERLPLLEIYRRPEADPWARAWFTEDERLSRYLNGMVSVSHESSVGIMTLRVRSFRPEDSRAVAEEMLRLGEELVNRLSERSREDTLGIARREVELAERRVAAAREALTAFRERAQSLDATGQARAAVETLGQMEAALAVARTELRERSAFMRPDNPQLVTTRNRIAALERQITEERARHTRGGEALPQQLAEFERLTLEREFADRQLTSAMTSLETARIEAQRQQMYLARVVEPNLAVYPLHPKKIITLISVFAGLSVAFGIGWLLVAGMREHAA